MTLADVIYEKSRELPEEEAREVIDFIDFLKARSVVSAEDEQRRRRLDALARLDEVRIDFGGRPMTDRDAAMQDGRQYGGQLTVKNPFK